MIPEIVIERESPDVPVPSRATDGAAGYDVCAWLHRGAKIALRPGERRLIPTGLKMRIPPHWECQVRPRSGLALKKGLTVLNTPGTIDSDYRGEVGVILVNLGTEVAYVADGERIAQLVFTPAYAVAFQDGLVMDDTGRAAGGFGSTGS